MLRFRTTHRPATDLGFLLHKNPGRMHEASLPWGRVRVVFPEATEDACSVAVLLDVDTVRLVRHPESGRWDTYVTDRPYVANSFLASALTEMFSTAMGGRCKERPELADMPIPLEFELPVVRCRGGEPFLRALFEPLGYEVAATPLALDPMFPEWGRGNAYRLTLRHTCRLQDALRHLYVLIPALDEEKHYFVNRNEIDKLMLRGTEWLPNHPAKEEIAKRYLVRDKILTRDALARLAAVEEPDPDAAASEADAALEAVERPLSLHEIRLDRVVEVLGELGAKRILDLGCGEGRLIQRLIRRSAIQAVVGVDVAVASLEKVKRRLRWDSLPERQRQKLRLVHGALTYRDRDLEGYDAAVLVEVIEHLDLSRLTAMERVVFGEAAPQAVIVTTPNREYNALFEGLTEGAMRHGDHRFEWTRAEFSDWSNRVAATYGYTVKFEALGPEDAERGAPSQMAVFER